uniref:Uncharacterized protein n=1 Tax=Nothobranchius furzeri TaxID=105023 RepID=A0A1A8A726_NOTFU
MDCKCNTTEMSIQCLARKNPLLFYGFCLLLICSLLQNLFFCLVKFCTVITRKRRIQLKKNQRQSSRQMEENPIYGNLSYTETNVALYTEAADLYPPVCSSSLRNPQDSQSTRQDCYANLTLKVPRPVSSHSVPHVHSEEAPSEEPAEAESEDGGNRDAVTTMTDVYASVQTQKSKTIDTVDGAKEYANHL